MANEPSIYIVGNLGGDAEMRTTPNGKLVTSFNLASTPREKKNDEWIDGETVWFRCFVWGKDATGAANELRKGSRVIINGRLSQNTWVDKEGVEKKSLEISVDEYGIKPKNVTEPVAINLDSKFAETVSADFPW